VRRNMSRPALRVAIYWRIRLRTRKTGLARESQHDHRKDYNRHQRADELIEEHADDGAPPKRPNPVRSGGCS